MQLTESVDDLPDIPEVTIDGDFLDRVDSIPYSQMNLLLSVGRIDDDHVLLPFVELKLGKGEDPDEPENVLTATISIENAAFLISDLAGDLRSVTAHVASLGTGRLRAEPKRIEFVRRLLVQAQDSLAGCLVEVEAIQKSAAQVDQA